MTTTCSGWQSDNTAALTVSTTGLLTAQGSGSAGITATCQGIVGRGAMTVALKSVAPSTFTLSGVVTDAYSRGMLPNISIQIDGGANTGMSAKTDATGRYVIAGVSPGTITVTMSALRYLPQRQTITIGSDARLDGVLQRNDALPTDGTYAYRLAVHSPDVCLTTAYLSDQGSGSWPANNWVTSDFTFDGQLVVDGDGLNLQFVVPPNRVPIGWNYSTFTSQRRGTQLAVSTIVLAGRNALNTVRGISVTNAIMQANRASGDTDNSGRFQGNFDGEMSIWHPGFPGDATWTCQASGFAWTLTPL